MAQFIVRQTYGRVHSRTRAVTAHARRSRFLHVPTYEHFAHMLSSDEHVIFVKYLSIFALRDRELL